MPEKYLLKNGERVTETSQLVPGEMYAIGWGKEGYRGFIMPEEERVSRSNGDLNLRNIRVYQVASNRDKPEVVVDNLDINFIALDLMGTFRLNKGSEIRNNIQEALIGNRESAVA